MNKKYTIDLHMHSMLSDGKETPVEVINTAKGFGLTKMVMTDHNTLHPNMDKLRAYAESQGIKMPFSGCEASVAYYNEKGDIEGTFHMLVYGEDDLIRDPLFTEAVGHYNDPYNKETIAELKRFNDAGYELSYEEAFIFDTDIAPMEKHDKGSERHLIKCLAKKKGRPYSEVEAEVEHLHTPREYNGRSWLQQLALMPDAKELIALCRRLGLVTVMAHPMWVENAPELSNQDWLPCERVMDIIRDLHAHGLDGVEVSHQMNFDSFPETLRGMAKELDMLTTGGSDYHAEEDYGQHVTEYGVTEEEFARLETLVHERAAEFRNGR